jgi:hemolysin activation/secretion protein
MKRIYLISFLTFFFTQTLIAQTITKTIAQNLPKPQAIPKDSPIVPLPIPKPLPTAPELNDRLPPQSPPGSTNSEVLPTVIQDFDIQGNSKFSREVLKAAIVHRIGEFKNKSLSFAQLLQAAEAITQYYLDRKYITTGAFIPADDQPGLNQGIVRIRVVEGSLEEIRIKFPPQKRQRISDEYVRSRIRSTVNKPLNLEELREGIQLLTLNPLLRNIQANLSPGAEPGTSALTLTLEEAPSMSAELLLDNNRSPSVGSIRRQFQFNQGNLLGLGDGFGFVYSNTNGSNLANLSYTLPLNPKGGTLSVNVGLSSSRIIESPFNVLNIDANSQSIELSVRQPILRKPMREFGIGASLGYRVSEATLLNGLTPFPSIGAEADGKTRVTSLRLFQDALWRGEKSVIALRSQLNLGLGFLGGTVNDRGPDSRFISWLGQAQWITTFAPDNQLVLRSDLQLADRGLLPSEQFGLGGQSSVRGYRQDALLNDAGFFASAEYRFPIWRSQPNPNNPNNGFLLQAAPFIDFGSAWTIGQPQDNLPAEFRTLASVGLGLRLQANDRFSARLDWGLPLIKLAEPIPGSNRSFQENGLYFSFVYKLL